MMNSVSGDISQVNGARGEDKAGLVTGRGGASEEKQSGEAEAGGAGRVVREAPCSSYQLGEL